MIGGITLMFMNWSASAGLILIFLPYHFRLELIAPLQSNPYHGYSRVQKSIENWYFHYEKKL